MSINLDESIAGIWFVQLSPTSDWMCALQRTDAGSTITYRFRYYNGADAFDSGDKKNWYSAKGDSSVEETIPVVSEMASRMAKTSGGERWELIRGTSTLDQFIEEFQKLPFIHIKQVSKEEYDKEIN